MAKGCKVYPDRRELMECRARKEATGHKGSKGFQVQRGHPE